MNDSAPTLWDLELRGFVRVPGLLRRWEIERVLDPGSEIHVEQAGEAADGTPLYAVYRHDPEPVRE